VLPAQPIEVRGIAWTGAGHVTQVEVRINGDASWLEAPLDDAPQPGCWRRWRLTWQPSRKGPQVLAVRATDSLAQSQPETPAWNRSGYLWNGIDSVEFDIR
jgi:hypothetical protein